MKMISIILAALLPLVAAGEAIHEKYLSEPYPQQDDIICINPAPLKVPLGMMQTEFMQFQMSMDRHFGDSTVITSEPVAWNIFKDMMYSGKIFRQRVRVFTAFLKTACRKHVKP